ncbi:MAG: hypothetical protein QXV21_03560 [Candidatus Bathyarchaeia archaeon]
MRGQVENKRIIVLDTSAFAAGFDPFSVNEMQYTVPLVREEVKGSAFAKVRLKTAIEQGKIVVKKPEKTFWDAVKASATAIGDKVFLSETDLQVLALALQLKSEGYNPVIASDDYSIQNVANRMEIEFASLATFGIRFQLEWVRYCPACYRKYNADYKLKKCAVCGTELKRKPLRKKHLNHKS